MKVAVIGSRNLVVDDLSKYLPADTDEIVSGGAKGIDACAAGYAKSHGLKLTEKEAIIADIHLPERRKNLLGAGIEVRADAVLQRRNKLPGLKRIGCKAAQRAKAGENSHQGFVVIGFLSAAFTLTLLLVLLIGLRVSPFGFCLSSVFLDLLFVKCGKIHGIHSCFLNFTGSGQDAVKSIPLHFKQMNLLGKRPARVKAGAVQNVPDLAQRKLKLPKQQDALQSGKCGLVVIPIAGVGYAAGLQKTDSVIVVQCAHADTGKHTDLVYGFHGASLP